MSFKRIFKQWRVWILIVCLFISYFSINYQFSNQGVIINGIEYNSTAARAGITNPTPDIKPTEREHILKVNSQGITTIDEFTNAIANIPVNTTFDITTNKRAYGLLKENAAIGITLANAPSSNLRKGIDLQGGTRVLLKPVTPITNDQTIDLMATMENRLNTYGLSDLTIRSASDLSGEKYVIVEIAGATKDEVKELVAGQGKFEAKIGNETVFEGGKKDITRVCKNDGTCSRVSTCGASTGGTSCRFEFQITLSPESAAHQAAVTQTLNIQSEPSGNRVLEKPLDLYLDGKLVSSLQIAADLKGQKATSILISGSGQGPTQKEAVQAAIAEMNKLQTILITGSLPTKLEIVKIDSISPSLGEQFVKNAIFIGLISLIGVAIVVYLRYRTLKIVIPMIITVSSEIFLVLGLAAMTKYNLDLASIAGIIASVGTGVDDQIVIMDELLFGEKTTSSTSIKQKVKKAFFVILAAYFVTVAAMLPLLGAGAGILKGFGLTTIAGVTIGVFITRPAYGAIARAWMEE